MNAGKRLSSEADSEDQERPSGMHRDEDGPWISARGSGSADSARRQVGSAGGEAQPESKAQAKPGLLRRQA